MNPVHRRKAQPENSGNAEQIGRPTTPTDNQPKTKINYTRSSTFAVHPG